MRQARRCKDDRALLEGPHLVGEALEAGVELEVVLATPGFLAQAGGRDLFQALEQRGGSLEEVEPDLLDAVMDADSPRGVAALARLPRPEVTTLPQRQGGVYVYADGLQDPGNLGALARSAEASGAAALALGPGTAHPNHPRALRASAGALLRLPVTRQVGASALEESLRELAPRWVALATRGGEDLWQPDASSDLQGTLILAVGAEGQGLSADVENRSRLRLTIPLQPPVESLNATVAASLVLFELRRRRGLRPG